MDFVTWIIFGLIVGVIANFVDPRKAQGGILGAIVLGVVGGVVGGYVGNLHFGQGVTGLNVSSNLVAVAGALLVVYAARFLKKT